MSLGVDCFLWKNEGGKTPRKGYRLGISVFCGQRPMPVQDAVATHADALSGRLGRPVPVRPNQWDVVQVQQVPGKCDFKHPNAVFSRAVRTLEKFGAGFQCLHNMYPPPPLRKYCLVQAREPVRPLFS